jgi:hypothetical protein
MPAGAAPLVLCDLDAPDALAAWTTSGTRIELSTEFAKGGKHSLKVEDDINRDWPSISTEKLATNDWSRFAAFECWVYNPQDFAVAFDIDFVAPDGTQYKPGSSLEPRQYTHIVVPIPGMKQGSWSGGWCGSAIDPSKVMHINLFTDKSDRPRTVYVSDIKLVPPLAAPAAPRGLRAESVSEGLRLTWAQDWLGEVREFRIYRYQPPDTDALSKPPYVVVRRPQLVDVGAAKGEAYVYRVVAVNTEGTAGPASAPVTGHSDGGPSALKWTKYGGSALSPAAGATGFFHVAQVNGRWTLVDPDGGPFFSVGLDCVGFGDTFTPIKGHEDKLARYIEDMKAGGHPAAWGGTWGSAGEKTNFSEYLYHLLDRDGDDFAAKWRQRSIDRMRGWGVNTFGAWCDGAVIAAGQMPYVSFAGGWGGAPSISGNLPDVFDPRFEAEVRADAQRQAAPRKTDPLLIGWFSANEMPWYGDWEHGRDIAVMMLEKDAGWECKKACIQMLQKQYETITKLNDAWGLNLASWDAALAGADLVKAGTTAARRDKGEMLREYADRYFRITTQAIKAADPNHLTLGPRFAGSAPREALEAAGKYCDVVSVNCYPPAFPRAQFDQLSQWAGGKPFIIGEFAYRGTDSGLPNERGAGTIVPTQTDRGLAYARYIDEALDTGYIVGCHWFQYIDEPATGRFDGENSNYGWVNVNDEPYLAFVDRARVMDLNWPLQGGK